MQLLLHGLNYINHLDDRQTSALNCACLQSAAYRQKMAAHNNTNLQCSSNRMKSAT